MTATKRHIDTHFALAACFTGEAEGEGFDRRFSDSSLRSGRSSSPSPSSSSPSSPPSRSAAPPPLLALARRDEDLRDAKTRGPGGDFRNRS